MAHTLHYGCAAATWISRPFEVEPQLVATSHCSGWPRSGHQQAVVGWTRTSSGKGVGLLTLHNPVLQVLTIQQQMFLLLHNDISHLGPTLAPDTKKWSHKCPMAANLLPNHKTPLRVQDHFLTFQLAETCDLFFLLKSVTRNVLCLPINFITLRRVDSP